MSSNYRAIISRNLERLFSSPPSNLASMLGGDERGSGIVFKAFGKECCLSKENILLGDEPEWGPRGVIISLYSLGAHNDPLVLEPLKAFREFPGSMPYQGAFSVNSEKVLIRHVPRIKKLAQAILDSFSGHEPPPDTGGDFSFVLYPLPKIALVYIFYMPDEEFPASVSCLFSANALSFMPLDGLADVAEYTSKGILEIISSSS